MGIETNPQNVDALNANWPADSEPAKEGGAHLRNIKRAVKAKASVLGQFGITALSSATDSDAEDVAATPKAVKTVKADVDQMAVDIAQEISSFESSVNAALAGLQFKNLKNANGYQELPGGIIILWGQYKPGSTVNGGTFSLPFHRTFPNACLWASISATAGVISGGTYDEGMAIQSITKSNLVIYRGWKYWPTGDVGVRGHILWLAIGY